MTEARKRNPFVAYLMGMDSDKDRGKLAVLRRGMNGEPVSRLQMARFIVPFIPDEVRNTARENAYYLTAALYAFHPSSIETGDMGSHLRLAVSRREDSDAAERRFIRLLSTELPDLDLPLRQAVAMLRQTEPRTPVNWDQLFRDLNNWGHPEKYVQRRWANSFWAYAKPAAEQEEAIESETQSVQS